MTHPRSSSRPRRPAPAWPLALPLSAALAGCSGLGAPPLTVDPEGPADTQEGAVDYRAAAVPADLADLFDPNPAPAQSYRVVGSYTPPAWSWGQIELLEGQQLYRTEGYNRRTDKLRLGDTFQSSDYPVRTHFGALNQQLVDGFNLYYKHACATATTDCPAAGPTRPEARFVLLHKGPKTATGACNTTQTPVLLVHGAMQDANVWLWPGGNDGAGNPYPGTVQKTGFVQALEAAGRCVYAVTYGNFHGDNYSQATNLANAVARVRALHKRADGTAPKVDVVAWSKGVLSADAYLGNAAAWPDVSTRYFDRAAAVQGAQVPAFRSDVRVYVALSGPHKGIDLNFRHPIHTLTIPSTKENAPVGRGPMPWTWFSALQCVNFGTSWGWFDNPYAYSACKDRGGTWPDFFTRIYVSNVRGLDTAGKPVSAGSLKTLNLTEGTPSSGFDFDAYNMSMFGSITDAGRWVNAYLGQLQGAYDLRADVPVPRRDSSAWADIDQDEARWYPWIRPKLTYLGGGYLDDTTRTACRKTAFDPAASPCIAWHMYYNSRNAKSSSGFYSQYELMGGLGIAAAVEMGGHFIQRLASQGLSSKLDALYVLHGDSTTAAAGSYFETDGMTSPTSSGGGDGVLFKSSIAALPQLTQGWTATKKSKDAKLEAVPYGHLEVGQNPAVWDKMIGYFQSRD